jgi:hypothetical protein
MAKAARKSSTDAEIWFNDAVMLLADELTGDADVAERLLKRRLKDGLPYSYLGADGIRVRGKSANWNALFLTIDRAANRAFISAPIKPMASETPDPDVPTCMDGIKVDRAAVLAMVPGKSKRKPPEGPQLGAPLSELSDQAPSELVEEDTKTRIANEARRMKREGEIPNGILKTAFATTLASKASVTMKYVRNHLTEWGLWPISDIDIDIDK